MVNVLFLGETPENSDYWFTRFRSYEEKPIFLEKVGGPKADAVNVLRERGGKSYQKYL